MAINQLNKYVWLVETIHRAKKRGGITLKEIQSRWLDSDLSEGTELSRRTFINNIHSIEELFEINIECGSGYRYNIEYGDCFEEGSTRSWMLKVDAFQSNYIRNLPLHESQKEMKRTDEYSIFEYHLKPEFDFEQEIFSNMDTMEVLEPQWLREEITQRLKNLTGKYQI